MPVKGCNAVDAGGVSCFTAFTSTGITPPVLSEKVWWPTTKGSCKYHLPEAVRKDIVFNDFRTKGSKVCVQGDLEDERTTKNTSNLARMASNRQIRLVI